MAAVRSAPRLDQGVLVLLPVEDEAAQGGVVPAAVDLAETVPGDRLGGDADAADEVPAAFAAAGADQQHDVLAVPQARPRVAEEVPGGQEGGSGRQPGVLAGQLRRALPLGERAFDLPQAVDQAD